MKKIFLSMAFVAIALSSQAQSLTGSLKELAQAGKAKLEFDYSKAKVHGLSEDEYCKMFEHDYFKDKPEVLSTFNSEFNLALDNTLVCSQTMESPFTIVVQVLEVKNNGTTSCVMHVMKKNADGTSSEVATVSDLKKHGGTYGSAMNLMKDGAKHLGKAAGQYMKKAINKAK